MDRGILEHGRVGQQVTAAASDLPQASKRGVGVSIGFGPLRYTLGVDGKVRRTRLIPGTGVYDVEEIKREEGGSTASSDTADDVDTVLGSSRAADCRGRHVGVG